MSDKAGDDRVSLELLQRRFDRQQQELDRLKSGDGGGTSGGMTDDWKNGVDRQLGQLHGDVRHLLYGLIAGFLLLAAGGLFRFEKIEDRLTAIEVSHAKMDNKIDQVIQKLDAPQRPTK